MKDILRVANFLLFVYEKKGRSTGLEPATFGTTIQRSSQLSYDRHGMSKKL
jgi:hypothetical protein